MNVCTEVNVWLDAKPEHTREREGQEVKKTKTLDLFLLRGLMHLCRGGHPPLSKSAISLGVLLWEVQRLQAGAGSNQLRCDILGCFLVQPIALISKGQEGGSGWE